MPIIAGSLSLGGASTNENILQGNPFEFLPYDALVEFALQAETGATVGDLVADIFSGSDLIATNFKLFNNGPIKANEGFIFDDEALAGERLTVRVRNTTPATARIFHWIIRITPL